MEKVMYEGKEHLIVADYGNGQIEIREVNGRRELLVSKDKVHPVPKKETDTNSHSSLLFKQKKNSLWKIKM